ncbi:MAG TPA: AgmX/PglI C-terminal domain-containing protein [Polyangiales bacterium]|nr:AgmX/PglI C-terminal domain-containing protein [Polyangiales bacterium]
MQSSLRLGLLGLIPMVALGCAARQSTSDGTARKQGACSKLSAAEVSSGLAEKLTASADVLSFEAAWKSEHQTSVSGTISRGDVTRVIRAQGSDIRGCYQGAMAKLPDDSRGKVVVRFVIDASGRVPAATIAADELGVPEVSCCLADRVSQWLFTPPTTGDFVVVEYPFSVAVSKS